MITCINNLQASLLLHYNKLSLAYNDSDLPSSVTLIRAMKGQFSPKTKAVLEGVFGVGVLGVKGGTNDTN